MIEWLRENATYLSFWGILIDLIAVFLLAQDWRYSRYKTSDWQRDHRLYRDAQIAELERQWAQFRGPRNRGEPNWKTITTDALLELAHSFPKSDDDEETSKRLREHVLDEFGVGQKDDDLFAIRANLERLADARRGWQAYRDARSSSAFRWAFGALAIGLFLQALGSIPSAWLDRLEDDPPVSSMPIGPLPAAEEP